MNWLHLTSRDGANLFINKDHIIYFHRQSDGNTYIQLTGNDYAVVMDTCDAILKRLG